VKKSWWKESIVYQIYPRSFKDSSGNGIGDINGIIEKLDYIKSLGVDIIWICPIYDSPGIDNGYDISNYKEINKDFGGNKALDELIEKVHLKGLKIIMDLVVNHTSDQHNWFKEAKKSKLNPYHDYYIWKDGKINEFPNNWRSVFGGRVWEWNNKTEEFFLHLYTKNQPDLNWENPKVRKEIYSIIDFWLSKGIDGFRMDVISLISKRLAFKNTPDNMSFKDVMEKFYANGPRVHEFLKEMNREVLSKYDIVTVGEGPGINLKNGLNYVAENEKELNMIFHFDHLTIDFGPKGKYDPIPLNFIRFKEIFTKWDNLLANKGWNSIFLGNHDFSRIVSRFGNDKEYRVESAKLLITLIMTLRGTPYIYQGDEIGMTNVSYPSIDFYNDIETLNAWKEASINGENMSEFLNAVHLQSRDNSRTPMQWNLKRNSGFTIGDPWIPVNKNYKNINVSSQLKDSNSILNYYKRIISFRKLNATLVYGNYKDLEPNHPYLFVYKRWDENNEFLIIHNFSEKYLGLEKKITLNYNLVILNYENVKNQNKIRPWETRVYKSR
tara:strand:- start:3059 stop:4714 length:1656 start_codon:yes stop_codon:yes gene_type:complete